MTISPLTMVCPPGSACPFSALGIPEILLWVLSFAVIFGMLTKLKIFPGRAASTLISIALSFLVLMAVPSAMIVALSTMSTGLLIVSIAFLVIMSLIEIAGVRLPVIGQDKDGKAMVAGMVHPFQKHGTLMAIALLVLAGIIFWYAGGAALIGVMALPTISAGTWLLVIVGGAVLWMLSGA
jgi:hypothetical protein